MPSKLRCNTHRHQKDCLESPDCHQFVRGGDVLMGCPSDVNSDVKLKSGNLKWDWNLENREFNFTIEWRLPTLTHT